MRKLPERHCAVLQEMKKPDLVGPKAYIRTRRKGRKDGTIQVLEIPTKGVILITRQE